MRAEERQLPGLTNVSSAAVGDEVSLDLSLRSMKRSMKGQGAVLSKYSLIVCRRTTDQRLECRERD